MSIQLRPYQIEAIQFIAYKKKALLAMDMGTGKSGCAIGASRLLKCERTLIVPPASLKTNWAREITLWHPGAEITLVDGSLKERRERIQGFKQGYLILNLETLRAEKNPDYVRGGKNKETEFYLPPSSLARVIRDAGFDMVILDESQRIASRKSMQSRGLKMVSKRIPHRLALSGTPIMNSVMDLWSQLNFIDPMRWSAYWSWAREYAGAQQNRITGIWEVLDHAPDPEKLDRHLAPIMYRKTKAEVLDLPEVTYQDMKVKLEGRQARLYRQMERRMIADLGDGKQIVAPILLAKLTRLKQLAIDPSLLDWHDPETKEIMADDYDRMMETKPRSEERLDYLRVAKYDALIDILQATKDKVIVFSHYTKALISLRYLLEQARIGAVAYTGEVKSTRVRDNIEHRWKTNPTIQVMLANDKAGGVGLNWTEASLVIFLDRPWNQATVDQCVSRAHRSGQMNRVHVISLQAVDTLDEWMETLLNYKGNLTDAVMERVRERCRETLG